MAEYSIPKSNLASLLERIDRLNKVADKLGQPRIVVTQGEPVWVPTGFEGPARMFIPIMVTGEAPKVAGWTFKAAIDHVFAEDGERMTIVRKPRDSGDADLPEQYRNPEPWCDHCHQTRLRKTTYIMQSDAGEWKQVGSNCLRDFLGHTDPEKLAEWFEHVASALHEAEQDDDDWGRDGHAPMVIRLSDLMAVTNHVARAGGWVSRKNAAEWDKPSTSDRVMDVLFPGTSEKAIEYARENRPTDDDVAAAEKCIEWAKQLCEAERTSDYEYSLCTIAKVGYVEGWRHLGLAVSMWAAWNREMGIDPRNPTAVPVPGVFQGTIGEKLERTVQVRRIIPIETAWGLSNIHVMTDADENTYVWRASGGAALPEGQEVRIKGTVKAHEAKYGKNQTVLTRVKEIKPKAPVDKADDKPAVESKWQLVPIDGKWWATEVSGIEVRSIGPFDTPEAALKATNERAG